MQGILLKVLPLFVFTAIFILLPQDSNAVTNSSVSVKQHSSSSGGSVSNSTKIRISSNGEGTTVVESSDLKSPESNQIIQQDTTAKTITSTDVPENPKVTVTMVVQPTAGPTPILTQQDPTGSPVHTEAQDKVKLTPTVQPATKPASLTDTETQESIKSFIIDSINNYRRSLGLSIVHTSQETCDFAKVRAKEISNSFNHDGFRNRINNKTMPYKSWSLVTENLAMTLNYKNVVDMWIASKGHAANMRKETPFVCVEKYGNYYAYEGLMP